MLYEKATVPYPILTGTERIDEMYRLSQLEQTRRTLLRAGTSETGTDPALDRILRHYMSWLEESRSAAAVKLNELQTRLAFEEFSLAQARKDSRRHSVNGERRSTPATREHAGRIQQLREEIDALVQQDPDFFFVQALGTLNRDMQQEHSGHLVDVPYLLRARRQISDSLDAGIPVYLVGHLGSGKTQLAIECAQEYRRKRLLWELVSRKMADHQKRHPKATGEEAFSYFEQIYPNSRKEADEADCHPYFIAGSHNLTVEDMFFEKTLKLAQAPGRNSGYGTIVEKVEKEVLKAIREGRPLVIDEINTIAMANLIGLNDILQHHAGQTAYITGVGSLPIADGFCLIGTGNLSTGTVTYEGTNVLNPAFQSRFTTIVYNYVPQRTEGTLEEALQPDHHPEQNELFRLLIEHLCAADGTLSLPDPARTLPALWRLAQLSRLSQDIFEGHNADPGGHGDAPVLNEAVLSIRNLFHVLDHWDCGEEEDLSMALWNGFLGSVTNPDDRNLLLALSARYGFFAEEGGWHIENRARGDAALTYEDIRTLPYRHHLQPLETLSREDVVFLLAGRGPKRTALPAALQKEIIPDTGSGADPVQIRQADESLRQLEHSALVLEETVQDPKEVKGKESVKDTQQ